MSPLDDLNHPMYRLQPGRGQNHGQDLTPHSAVSSFNLPAAYDANLITPVSMTSSPNMPDKPMPTREANLSPLMVSPTVSYQLGWEGESYSPHYLQPHMKSKDRSASLNISTSDPFLPPSPSYVVAPNIYYGNYGVSTPSSARTTDSLPSLHQSPHSLQQSPHMSAGGMSNHNHPSMNHPSSNGALFRQSNPAPILIAPNPSNRRFSATVKQDYGPSRQSSMSSTKSPPHSGGPIQGAFSGSLNTQPSRGKKNQKRKVYHSDEYLDELMASGDINHGEQVLMALTRQNMQWKEITSKWCAEMNENKSIAALQMRKKRLLERLEERALSNTLSDYEDVKSDVKWEFVKENVHKHSSRETWTRSEVEKHFNDHQQDYELPVRKRSRSSSNHSHSTWSDGHISPTHESYDNSETANLVSALSAASMDEVRSRATSDACARYQIQRQQSHNHQQDQQLQAHAMFVQSNQHQQTHQQQQQHHHQQQQQHHQHHPQQQLQLQRHSSHQNHNQNQGQNGNQNQNHHQHNWGPGS